MQKDVKAVIKAINTLPQPSDLKALFVIYNAIQAIVKDRNGKGATVQTMNALSVDPFNQLIVKRAFLAKVSQSVPTKSLLKELMTEITVDLSSIKENDTMQSCDLIALSEQLDTIYAKLKALVEANPDSSVAVVFTQAIAHEGYNPFEAGPAAIAPVTYVK